MLVCCIQLQVHESGPHNLGSPSGEDCCFLGENSGFFLHEISLTLTMHLDLSLAQPLLRSALLLIFPPSGEYVLDKPRL